MKLKTLYLCRNCKQESSKWMGRCPSCNEWNTFEEEVVNVGKAEPSSSRGLSKVKRPHSDPQSLQSLAEAPREERLKTGIEEWDSVMGGGFVKGSLTLLSGEPGIGKSTLTLQIIKTAALQNQEVLYVTGEESLQQVAARARRMGIESEKIRLHYETALEDILLLLENQRPQFAVIDSIQVMASDEIPGTAGSLSQVRAVTEALMHTAKSLGITVLLIGHVNKEGQIAGPKVLEHLVDTVLILEGDRDHELRLLRSLKNRFGPVNEVGLFEMTQEGLAELHNPGERILKERPHGAIGSVLTLTLEGNRPLLMEVQALVNTTPFGYPKRTASGFDRNRLELLIAVLQKYTPVNLMDQDVYINVVGGLSLNDPSADLAICAAIASSFWKKAPSEKEVIWGEVGLSGEIRKHHRDQDRQKSAQRMGLLTQPTEKKLLDELKKRMG